jgi:hypothetical protein
MGAPLPTPLGRTASPAQVPERPATGEPGADLTPQLPTPLGRSASPTEVTARLERIVQEGELNPCEVRRTDEKLVDRAQRWLYETLCATSLWFDGLFGDDRHLGAALNSTGRIELAVLHSDYEGTDVKMRGAVRTDFPNLDRRIHAFFGRDDQDEFITDRTDRLTLRSQFINVETNEGWLAGLGYGLPGSYRQKTDFRIGGKLGHEPRIFVQGRHRRNWVLNRQNIWRARETVYWTNREGFGITSAIDYDHIFRRAMLLRWATIGTFAENTLGLEYRSAVLLYQDLPGHRAIAYETFLRGATDSEVEIRDYGARAIYRQSLLNRGWLVGEAVLGYSWPRELRIEPREGSVILGLGVEMHFGRELMEMQ